MTRRSALLSFSLVLLIMLSLACSFVRAPTPTLPSTATPEPPTATLEPATPTPELPTDTPPPPPPTSTAPPQLIRIQFEPGATSAAVTGHLEAGGSRVYALRASADQTMQVQATATEAIQLHIEGADGTVLKGPDGETAWQGKLPATQDYVISVISVEGETDYTLTVVIGPLGWEDYRDEAYGFEMWYPEDFTVDRTCHPVAVRGDVALGLRLTGSDYYSGTNLLNACVIVGVDQGEDARSTCLEARGGLEESQGKEQVNGIVFQVWSSQEGAAGNVFEEVSYRTIHGGACYEITLLLHAGNIGAYPEGTVTEFDRGAVLERLKQVVHTFRFLEQGGDIP